MIIFLKNSGWTLLFAMCLAVPGLSEVDSVRVASGDFVELTRLRHDTYGSPVQAVVPGNPPRDEIRDKVTEYASEIRRTHDLVEILARFDPSRLGDRTADAILL